VTTQNSNTQPRDFGFGADETLVRDQARKLLAEFAGPGPLRKYAARDPQAVYARGDLPGYDRAIWRRCVELGWPALAVPESCGGIGAKMVGVAALVEEIGRHVFPSPCVATLVASCVLRSAGTPGAERWLSRIVGGSTLSLALTGQRGSWELDQTGVTALAQKTGLTLDGTAYFVQDAFKVDAFLVAARSADGIALVVVDKRAPGVSLKRDHILDLSRDQGHLTLTEVVAREDDVVALPLGGLGALRRAWPSVLTLISADLVGASEWLLQTTVEYAKVRKQFDKTIGSFQAVKHPLVDAMMEIDLARSHLYNAACAIDEGHEDVEVSARMAKSAASDAAAFMSGRAVQLHGGIGFTWDCDVHFFFKRNQHNQALYGDGVHQRQKLSDLLIGPVSESHHG